VTLAAGLCSVTLRDHDVGSVVEVAAAAGLERIEWGGDVHVPHGDLDAAAHAAKRTASAGLSVASYGSYLFCDDHGVRDAARVCDTAVALGAPLVRVWCPWGLGPDADDTRRDAVAAHVDAVAGTAASAGLELYLEFHAGTLTATAASALDLLGRVGAGNVRCGWQPPYWAPQPLDADLADLRALSAHLAHVHVYAWSGPEQRHPLADEADRWAARLAAAAEAPTPGPVQRAALVEFVRDDDPEQLLADARTLRALLSGPGGAATPAAP
jgi:sugar phosphate isomerase/epimerase